MEPIYHLCAYDKRNPDCVDVDDFAESETQDCYCDNCFSGRAELAEKIIDLQAELDKAKAVLKQWYKSTTQWEGCDCEICNETREVLGIKEKGGE